MRTVVVHANTMTRKHNRGRIILILQAWLVPCHGFGSTSCLQTSHVALRALQRHAPLLPHDQRLRTLSDVVRRRLSRLGMTEQGEGFHDPDGDESQEQEPPWGRGVGAGSEGIIPVQPFREEHTAGGSKFSELLARAKGENPVRYFQAAPRHPVPPEGPIDSDQDSQWEDQLIGSPNLPDPPLRNEMPGLRLSPEIDYDGLEEASPGNLSSGGGGDRFQRMMQQAQTNDQRQAAGISPGSAQNTRSSRADARPLPPSKEEKERALKAAVERQQNMMAKARGINLDDPTLEGTELAKKRALSRAQAEATTGGYVPSSNASDDYLAALKADSKRKHRDLHARLEGRALAADEPNLTMKDPEAPALASPKGDLQQGETSGRKFVPQRRTKAMSSIQNSADVYMASLKGVKVEIPNNPYLTEEGELARPGQKLSPEQIGPSLPPSPKQQPPTSTTMTYTERLKLARAAKSSGTTTPPTARSTAPAPAVDVPSNAPAAVAPDTRQPVTPVVSYAEKLKLAREAKAVRVAGSPPPPPVQTVRAIPFLAPTRLRPDAFEGADLEEDDTHAKIMRTMDLLTEHKTKGLVGEEKVAKLRRALVGTRDALRAEMREQPAPWKDAQMSVPPPIAPPSAPQPPRLSPASAHQHTSQAAAAPPTSLTADDRDTLRRCSVLLQAHAHSGLSGRDLVALREGLASSLEIVEGRVGGGVSVDSGTNGGGRESAPPSESEMEAVPASVGGIQSVGGILTEMGVSRKPDAFQPDNNSGGNREWTGGSLGEYEKGVGTKALGYLLKHRGGKGYGRGRVKGAQAEEMVSTLAELTEIFQEEMIED